MNYSARCFKAVFFDFDGVVGRTMDDNYRAWRYAFSKYGKNLNKHEYFLTEGMNTKKIASCFLGNVAGKKDKIRRIIELKEKYYLENNKFSLYPGVNRIIPSLKKKNYRLGLVSGGSFSRISTTLGNKFLGHFDIIVTGDKILNPKPHPEAYLKAARRLSIKPSECIVVENAPLGIASAKKAKMYCVAVSTTLEHKFLLAADKIIDRFSALEEILL